MNGWIIAAVACATAAMASADARTDGCGGESLRRRPVGSHDTGALPP